MYSGPFSPVTQRETMKKFWAVMAVLLTFTLPMEAAHAKRFGGGKSFGRTYQTTPHSAPAQPSRADAAPAARQQQAPLPQQSSRKGMLGGLFGGLLAGGLLAALFAGGAFEGIQFMDVLLIAAVFFAIMFILRQLRGGAAQGRARPAYAGAAAGANAGTQQRDSQPAFGANEPVFGQRGATAPSAAMAAVPMNLPHGFDSPAFLEGAKNHYRILQSAWNDNDLVKIREYCTPALYDLLRVERASLPAAQHTEVLTLASELVRGDQAFGLAEVSIRFSGRYRDAVEGVEADFIDIWHLERDYGKADAPWLITGVESH